MHNYKIKIVFSGSTEGATIETSEIRTYPDRLTQDFETKKRGKMAHYFLPVILPFGTPDNTESKLSALEKLMNLHQDEEWDYYRVGGRWNGAILGKSDINYYNGGEEQEQIGNNCTVANLLRERLEGEVDQENILIPYFFLTPDGQWLCNDDSDRNMYLSVLSEYPDCFVIGVDIHN